ncbi:chemotaxis protein CheA [Marinobacter sediminum]|uniref:chemotaxis protein CheA n=1 Tax=Marinobacter sediminum TaxID=256323 RepID=UPI00193A07F4|nr:chemotaxis protein CheA [Marinobacter sediminum]
MVDPLATFKEEAREHLVALEDALLELDENPTDEEVINTAFRSMHTIKGAAGMFGYQALSDFTHHLETVFDKCRKGELLVSPGLISTILKAKDYIHSLLADPDPAPELLEQGNQILQELHDQVPVGASGEPSEQQVTPKSSPASVKTYRLAIRPHAGTFKDGFDLLPVLRELSGLGEFKLSANTGGLPDWEHFEPDQCYLTFQALLTTKASADDIDDVFIFVQDDWQVELSESSVDEDAMLGDILVDRGVIKPEQLRETLEDRPKLGQILQTKGVAESAEVERALAEQELMREPTKSKEAEESIKVASSKLDALMDLVGELVIVQARMAQLAKDRDDPDIEVVSEEMERLTTYLRDQTLEIRMVPIGVTFGRYRRLVRDLSVELGKQIKLNTTGADTELDKMVIDRLADPMLHLIRNSIDHGIEAPEEREAAGKSPHGTVHLSAEHDKGAVLIRIRDDGRGIDAARVRRKAEERGLLSAGEKIPRDELLQMIFQPGFSTAEQVSDISGRGVGMDVVKRSIEALRGSVRMRSEEGEGTEFEISLPMTLAIIEGLMVAVEKEKYVIPLAVVEECIEVSQGGEEQQSEHLIKNRGALLPFVRLRDQFVVDGNRPNIEQVVVVNTKSGAFGVAVDEVIGQYQTVIKKLGKLYERTEGITGATILGDGGVALILDTDRLASSLNQHSGSEALT